MKYIIKIFKRLDKFYFYVFTKDNYGNVYDTGYHFDTKEKAKEFIKSEKLKDKNLY